MMLYRDTLCNLKEKMSDIVRRSQFVDIASWRVSVGAQRKQNERGAYRLT
jgi:hypothetical protein